MCVCELLNTGKARIAEHVPFTIQLLYENNPTLQSVMMAEDPGRTNIGTAVVGLKGQLDPSAVVETRNKEIHKLMDKRLACRRASRNGERKARQSRAKRFGTMLKAGRAHAETAPVRGRWIHYLPCNTLYRSKILQPETFKGLGDTNGRTADPDTHQPGA